MERKKQRNYARLSSDRSVPAHIMRARARRRTTRAPGPRRAPPASIAPELSLQARTGQSPAGRSLRSYAGRPGGSFAGTHTETPCRLAEHVRCLLPRRARRPPGRTRRVRALTVSGCMHGKWRVPWSTWSSAWVWCHAGMPLAWPVRRPCGYITGAWFFLPLLTGWALMGTRRSENGLSKHGALLMI
jgi:hypothetical protein